MTSLLVSYKIPKLDYLSRMYSFKHNFNFNQYVKFVIILNKEKYLSILSLLMYINLLI